MNAISKALQEIRFNIPFEVLHIAFITNEPYVASPTNLIYSLDERIRSSVINSRVIVDCNMIGGDPVIVYLSKCSVNEILPGEFIVQVPKVVTGGRSIVAPLSVVSNFGHVNTATFGYTSPLLSAANNMYNNLASDVPMQSSRLELIGDNVIMIKDPSIYLYNAALKCVLEYSPNMSSLHPRFILAFSKLCVLACKAYIYNTCLIKMDQAFLYGGHELNSATSVIEGYADAEQMYQEYIQTEFRKILYMNSGTNMSSYIRSMFGNNT